MESADAEVLEEARDAMRSIARELARFFATTGIAVHDFDHAFRAELIATLSEHLQNGGVEPTVARLALTTGLSRSAVEQAISQRASDSERPRTEFSERGVVLGLATLTSLWTSDSRFTAVYGVPRDLAVLSTQADASLEFLAQLAMPGASFDSVLRALKDHELIEIQGSVARLKSQTVFFRNLDAQVVSHYGRMVSGLMRNLRVNRERRHENADDKPWNAALVMDRPIAGHNVDAFLEIVKEGGDRWIRNLESAAGQYGARPGEEGRRYAACVFVAPEAALDAAVADPAVGDARRPYQRAMVTAKWISRPEAQVFGRYVADTGSALLHSIDAEHKTLLAEPGQAGTRLVVCCYMFDVTGSAETAAEAIDLLDARAPRQLKLRNSNARG
jgi:DNA-binding transcriptional ArsR family regulator